MGTDKAALRIGGSPLWERQLTTLRLAGAQEILISGPADGPYAGAGWPIVPDETPGAGPLAGLCSGLRRAAAEWVMPLAIDLPAMTSDFLRRLLEAALATRCGLVPVEESGRLHPLAAVYPRACLDIAEACLGGEDHSLRHFVQRASGEGLLRPYLLAREQVSLFVNLNTPVDLAAFPGKNPAEDI